MNAIPKGRRALESSRAQPGKEHTAMTNEQIIENTKQKLLAQGILKPTGRTLFFRLDDGSEIELPEAEEMHTFQAWKSRGFSVRKGEKAIARLSIWKYITRKESIPMQDGTIQEQEASRMYMKDACFFSRSQVDRIA